MLRLNGHSCLATVDGEVNFVAFIVMLLFRGFLFAVVVDSLDVFLGFLDVVPTACAVF